MTVVSDGSVHGPIHQLGPEWVPGADGVRFRRAARVILLDADDRVLLLHGSDVDQRERSWWFTVGGGIDPGESQRAAAARELFEEAGIMLDPAALVGPVYSRVAMFDFFRETCRQEEVFFLGRYAGSVGHRASTSRSALPAARTTSAARAGRRSRSTRSMSCAGGISMRSRPWTRRCSRSVCRSSFGPCWAAGTG